MDLIDHHPRTRHHYSLLASIRTIKSSLPLGNGRLQADHASQVKSIQNGFLTKPNTLTIHKPYRTDTVAHSLVALKWLGSIMFFVIIMIARRGEEFVLANMGAIPPPPIGCPALCPAFVDPCRAQEGTPIVSDLLVKALDIPFIGIVVIPHGNNELRF